MNEAREFLLSQLRKANKELAWWEDMLLAGNIEFTGEIIKEE